MTGRESIHYKTPLCYNVSKNKTLEVRREKRGGGFKKFGGDTALKVLCQNSKCENSKIEGERDNQKNNTGRDRYIYLEKL